MTRTRPRRGSEIFGRHLRRSAGTLAVAGGLAVATAALDLVRPWTLLLVVDNAIGHRPLDQPWATMLAPVSSSSSGLALLACLAFLALGVSGAVVGYLSSFLADAGAEQVADDLRADLHSWLLRPSPRLRGEQRGDDLAARVTDDIGRVQDALVAGLTNLMPRSLSLIGSAIALVAIDPALALASLMVIAPIAVTFVGTRRTLRSIDLDHRGRQSALAARVTEVMRTTPLVQAFAHEPYVERIFRTRSQDVVRSGLVLADVNARQQATASILVAAGATLVLWITAATVAAGQMTIGLLVLALWYATSAYGRAGSLTRLTSVVGGGVASLQRAVELMSSDETTSEGARVLPNPRRGIVLRHVSFGYDPGRRVLRGLDLEIPAGGILCIVGPSGAGKTTLLSLLLRLYDPDEGSIEIDGIDLKAFHPRSVRERIALVPQDPVLLDGSLMQNIALSRPGSSRAELMEAARLAQVEDFAHSLPAGYDTQIVEGGARLSAGQRWRVALARALMRRAPVLLLDDPSAGIDLEEEPRLLAAIRGLPGARTVVMVTRAVTLAPQADRTVGLREGRIEVSAPLASLNLGAGTAAPSQEL